MNIGALAASQVPATNTISAHKHDREDEEFHLILSTISDKSVRNQVYKDIVGVVNDLNISTDGHHTLSSIALPNKQEILAIGGVRHDNFDDVSSRVMNLMRLKGYSTGSDAYAPPVQNLSSISTVA